MINAFVRFFLENKLVVWLLLILFVGWGLATAPFEFDIPGLPRDPVAVDAIPDIGENQQIVFHPWAGQSPQHAEGHIPYPLTSSLLRSPLAQPTSSYLLFGLPPLSFTLVLDLSVSTLRCSLLDTLTL